MHLVDLLPYEGRDRVAASYDALRFPENKKGHTQLATQGRSPLTLPEESGEQGSPGAAAEGRTREPHAQRGAVWAGCWCTLCRSKLGGDASHSLAPG